MVNKSTAGANDLLGGYLIEDKKFTLKMGHNSEKNVF